MGLYTAAMEGDPAGEGAGVGGGACLLGIWLGPALPVVPVLTGSCPGLVKSSAPRVGEA